MRTANQRRESVLLTLLLGVFLLLYAVPGAAVTVKDVRARGELRHLGIPYANFIDGQQGGLDAELVRLFANELGVRYTFVTTTWESMFADLTGWNLSPDAPSSASRAPAGDLLASGITIFPWRESIAIFSQPTFPTQVWLLAYATSPLRPIVPSNSLQQDIAAVRARTRGKTIIGRVNTCTDPSLYQLDESGAICRSTTHSVNMLAPAILRREADATLLDMPDALVALNKWPGQLKVIGPISEEQLMGVAFAPDSTDLRDAFNAFFQRIKKDGTYVRLVSKYYPDAFSHFPTFFSTLDHAQAK